MTNNHPSSATHIAQVIGLLNERADYAVLRNFEELPHGNASRDIDIIITRDSLRRVRHDLIELIDTTGWKIITYLNSDRLITYVTARNNGDTTEIVQWDFFVDTSVFGIELMSAAEFLKGKKFNGFLWHVDEDARFLDKYLYNRVVGAQYPAKYASTRRVAEKMPTVEAKLRDTLGVATVAEGDKASSRRMLLHAFMRRPLRNMGSFVRFEYTRLANYFRSTGFSVGFTGPDGAGKTTVIDRMIDRLGPVFRQAHGYFHFRPQLFGNMGEVAHKAGVKKNVDRNYDKPHRGGRTGELSSLARLAYYSADYVAGHWMRTKRVVRITRLAIYDRYFTDIICDSRRSRIYLSPRFLNLWRALLIPSLDYNILLTASTSVILQRKRELDADGIAAINAKIDYLAPKRGYLKVMNDSTPDEAVTTILNHIFEKQHRHNLRRLGYK